MDSLFLDTIAIQSSHHSVRQQHTSKNPMGIHFLDTIAIYYYDLVSRRWNTSLHSIRTHFVGTIVLHANARFLRRSHRRVNPIDSQERVDVVATVSYHVWQQIDRVLSLLHQLSEILHP